LAILLTRMKIFNSFVRKHFTQKPQLIASSLFLTCLFIDSPVAFALKISSYHYYTDNKQENVNTFYIMTASDFSLTPYGQLLLAFTSFFLNLLLTLVVGVILNIVSVCQYKLYLRGKKQRDEAYKRASNPGKSEQVLKRQETTVKEANERKAEKNLLLMALTLSSISILSRILLMFSYVFYFVLPDFNKRIIACSVYLIYTLAPSASIFVFYSFNKLFRSEFNSRILRKRPLPSET
jgi:hypothetical protein